MIIGIGSGRVGVASLRESYCLFDVASSDFRFHICGSSGTFNIVVLDGVTLSREPSSPPPALNNATVVG